MLSRFAVSSVIFYPSCLIQCQATEVPQDTDKSQVSKIHQVSSTTNFQDYLENHEYYTSLGKRLLQGATDPEAINLDSSRQLIVDILSNIKLMKDYLRREKCRFFLKNPCYHYDNWQEQEQKFDPSEVKLTVVDVHTVGGFIVQKKTILFSVSTLDAKAIQFYLPYLLNYSCFLGIKIKALTSNAQNTPKKTFFENNPSNDNLLLSILSLFVELRKLKEELHGEWLPRFITCLRIEAFKTMNGSQQSITTRIGDKSVNPEIQKMERIRSFLFKERNSAEVVHSLLENYDNAIAKAWNFRTTQQDKEKYEAHLTEERNKKLEQPLEKFRSAFKPVDQKVLVNYYNNLKSQNEITRKIRKFISDELINNPWTFDGEALEPEKTFPNDLPHPPVSVPTLSAQHKIHLTAQTTLPSVPSKPAPSQQPRIEEKKSMVVKVFPNGRTLVLGKKSERRRREEEERKNAEALQQPIASMPTVVNNKSQTKQNKQQEQLKSKKNNQQKHSNSISHEKAKPTPQSVVKTTPPVQKTSSSKDNELQCVILPDGRTAWLGSMKGINESKPVSKTLIKEEPKSLPQAKISSAPQISSPKEQGRLTPQSGRGKNTRNNNFRQNTVPVAQPMLLTVEKEKIEPKKISMEPISAQESRKWSQVVTGEPLVSLLPQEVPITPKKIEEKKEEIKNIPHKRQRKRKYKTVNQNVPKVIQEASPELPQTSSENTIGESSSVPNQGNSARKEEVQSQDIILGPILDPGSQPFIPTYYDQAPPPVPYLDPELFPAGAYCYGPVPQITPPTTIGSSASPATVVNHYHIYPTPIIYQPPVYYYYDETAIPVNNEEGTLPQEENLQVQGEIKTEDAENETSKDADKEGL